LPRQERNSDERKEIGENRADDWGAGHYPSERVGLPRVPLHDEEKEETVGDFVEEAVDTIDEG